MAHFPNPDPSIRCTISRTRKAIVEAPAWLQNAADPKPHMRARSRVTSSSSFLGHGSLALHRSGRKIGTAALGLPIFRKQNNINKKRPIFLETLNNYYFVVYVLFSFNMCLVGFTVFGGLFETLISYSNEFLT